MMDSRRAHTPDGQPPHPQQGATGHAEEQPRSGRSENRESVNFYDYAVSPAARNARNGDPSTSPEACGQRNEPQPDEAPPRSRPSAHPHMTAHPPHPGRRPHPVRRPADRKERPAPGTPLSINNVRADSGIGGHARGDVYVSHDKRTSWTEAVYRPAKPARPWGAYILLAAAIAIIVALAVWGASAIRSCSPQPSDGDGVAPAAEATPDQAAASYDSTIPTHLVGEGAVTASGNGRVTFCAVGDNVINQQLIDFADSCAGESGDDSYDFSPLYRYVSPTISNFDLAFINQETVMGSNEDFDFAGYPSFNSPDILASNLVDAGWDMFNCNSNHTYDIGSAAILHEIELWKAHPDVVVAGMYETEEDAQTIRVIERNGIRIAFLSYNYGLNGYENNEVEDGSLVNFFTDEKLERDIPRAKAASDAVVVSMHWGTEYTNEPDDTQRTWAQKCADLGADVVVGTHTHFIQPMEWIEGADGGKTLVAWCLGDFASGYTWIDCILGGMMSCDFVRGEGGGVTVENVKWTPTIEHMENGVYSVHFLKDYTADMAQRNELFSPDNYSNSEEALADPIGYVRAKTTEVIEGDFPIDM